MHDAHPSPVADPQRRVTVLPFTRQAEGAEVVIGRPETGVFLVLPAEAVEVLDDLAAGRTVDEAQRLYRERHGETPDVEDLLQHLAAKGLVAPWGELPGAGEPPPRRRAHLAWIPDSLARRLFGGPALLAYALLVALAALAVLVDPGVVPGWRSVYFPRDTAPMLFALMSLGLVTTFFHELGHLLAAKARGVASRFSIGHRLWFLVWETDITGVWALPRRARYLPILAGPLVDLVSASALVLVFFAARHGLFDLAPRTLAIGRALLFIYLLRILWQCYFFLHTDFYYAIANLFGCKSLMRDTETLLRGLARRLLRRGPGADLSYLPTLERRMVRAYSGIWLLGRGVAFGLLFFVHLPLLLHYLPLLAAKLTGGGSGDATPGGSTASAALFLLFFGSGLALWLRSLLRSKG